MSLLGSIKHPVQATVSSLFDGAIQRGSAHPRAQRWSEAADCFREAMRLFPGHPDAFNCLGVLAFATGDFISARVNFERGLRAAPASELIHTNLADLLVLNVSGPNAMQSLCAFLGIEWTGQTMLHSDKT